MQLKKFMCPYNIIGCNPIFTLLGYNTLGIMFSWFVKSAGQYYSTILHMSLPLKDANPISVHLKSELNV